MKSWAGRWVKNNIRRQVRSKLKGSQRDPFLYLALISFVLFGLVATASFSTNFNSLAFSERPQSQERAFLASGTQIKESPDLSLIQKNSLAAISPPMAVTPQVLGALVESTDYQWADKTIVEYAVEPGDNLWSIAEEFNISLDTVLWANNLNKNSYLQIDQKLVILPVSGVIHHVQKGDSVSTIAQTYKTKTDEILAFNDLSSEDDIYIGDILIVPDGVMPPAVVYASSQVPIASSYFICPISQPCRITQGLHWYNAIDFSHGKCGEPVYAAAAGTVLKVALTNSASKWAFGGAGNHITVLHPNGVVTMYGHIQTSFVGSGDYISQGQAIALIGGAYGMAGSGNSTGCHLHFGVSGGENHFAQ